MIMPSMTEWGSPSMSAAVHERARVALVAVADHGLDLGSRFLGMLPLEACREARAAAAAKAGLLDDIDDLVGLHLGQHLGQTRIAVLADGVVDIAGIDKPVPVERHTLLFFIERDVLHRDVRLGQAELRGRAVSGRARRSARSRRTVRGYRPPSPSGKRSPAAPGS